jgi:hypothetical protein
MRYKNQKVILRKGLIMAQIIKTLPNEKFLVSFYDEKNKFIYEIIEEAEIIDNVEYNIIKSRINKINIILDN